MAPVLSGFVLLEVAFAILILGVMGTLGLTGYRTICEHRAYSTTEKRIEHVFIALAHFAKRTGTLPCPATPESMGDDPNKNDLGCLKPVGFVPYAALGISEREATDGWQRPLVYAVDQALHCRNSISDDEHILKLFCQASQLDLSVSHNLGGSASTHPAVVLLSHGPTGPNSSDPTKIYNANFTGDFVDQSPDNTFDDIVRFVTRENLLAFYAQTSCPAF